MCEPKGNPARAPDGLVDALSAELYRTIREKL
jgi:hypothetical protein